MMATAKHRGRQLPGRRTGSVRAAAALLICAIAAPFLFASAAGPAHANNLTPAQKRVEARKLAADKALERARRRSIPSTRTATKPAGKAASAAATNGIDAAKPLTLADKKAWVLAAPPEAVRRVGRHVITGYHTPGQLAPLIERGAIGGVFATARNVRRRPKAKLAEELKGLREAAQKAGITSFWVSTDQEGGSVSRMSPPAPYQVSLPRMLRNVKPEHRTLAAQAYADKQARALADLGINLNFAPVADLNHNVRAPGDRFTKIRYRAISSDPAIVTEVARAYCERFARANMYCTLKHFPGLGRVAGDTHITGASLKTPAEELAKADWIPFREVLADTPAFLMVGHHQVTSLDAGRPASTSPAVVQKLVRDEWKFEGVIVTDDLAMGAILRRKGGMAAAAVDSLNAGVDLLLVGSDGDQVYDVLYGLLTADEKGELNAELLAASRARLEKTAGRLTSVAGSNTKPGGAAMNAAPGGAASADVTGQKTKTARQ